MTSVHLLPGLSVHSKGRNTAASAASGHSRLLDGPVRIFDSERDIKDRLKPC